MLRRVGMARAEQNREDGHGQRNDQREVADQRQFSAARRRARRHHRFERGRHRLQLQGDVGHRADDRDQRHGRGDRLALAVTRGDEIGDGGDVVGLGELHDAAQQRRAQPHHDDRAEINGKEFKPGAAGEPDRAEEGP